MYLILVLIKFSQHSYPEEAVMHVFDRDDYIRVCQLFPLLHLIIVLL